MSSTVECRQLKIALRDGICKAIWESYLVKESAKTNKIKAICPRIKCHYKQNHFQLRMRKKSGCMNNILSDRFLQCLWTNQMSFCASEQVHICVHAYNNKRKINK